MPFVDYEQNLSKACSSTLHGLHVDLWFLRRARSVVLQGVHMGLAQSFSGSLGAGADCLYAVETDPWSSYEDG